MEITPTQSRAGGDPFFKSGWSRTAEVETQQTLGIDPVSYEIGRQVGFDDGHARGLQEGRTEGRDAGHQEGLAEGVEAGRDEMRAEWEERFRAALFRAFEEAELVFLEARREFDLSPEMIYLRRLDGLAFEALLPVPEAEFVSDRMLALLDQVGGREEEFEGEPFSVSFRFLPLSDATREELIYGEGYEFTYARGRGSEGGE